MGKETNLTIYQSNIRPELLAREHTRGQLLAWDFTSKAERILSLLEEEYVITLPDGTEIRRKVEDQQNGLGATFLGRAIDSLLSRFRYNLAKPNGDGAKHAANLMGNMRQLALLMPQKIPHYFETYKVNPDLKIRGSYYSDGTIERFEEETEPVILFAKALSATGQPIPSRFEDLVALYKQEQFG